MPVIVVLGCGIAFALIAGVVVAGMRARNRALVAKMRGIAESLGLAYEEKGEAAFREAWSTVPGLRKRSEVHHVIFGEYEGLPVTCFRHRYVMSTGHSTAVIIHWVFATDTPHWPDLHIQRRAWLARVCGLRSRVSDDVAFDRAWAIRAASPAFAKELVTGPVREFLMGSTAHLTKWGVPRWHFVGGKMCLVVRGDLKPERVRVALDHLVGMWSALAPV